MNSISFYIAAAVGGFLLGMLAVIIMMRKKLFEIRDYDGQMPDDCDIMIVIEPLSEVRNAEKRDGISA